MAGDRPRSPCSATYTGSSAEHHPRSATRRSSGTPRRSAAAHDAMTTDAAMSTSITATMSLVYG